MLTVFAWIMKMDLIIIKKKIIDVSIFPFRFLFLSSQCVL